MKRIGVLVIGFCMITKIIFSDNIPVFTLKIPLSITKSQDKLSYAYEIQEKLRLLHNEKGKDFREGKISEQEWKIWLKNFFNPKHFAINNVILQERDNLNKQNNITINNWEDFFEKQN